MIFTKNAKKVPISVKLFSILTIGKGEVKKMEDEEELLTKENEFNFLITYLKSLHDSTLKSWEVSPRREKLCSAFDLPEQFMKLLKKRTRFYFQQVKELIGRIKKFNSDMEVVTAGDDEGRIEKGETIEMKYAIFPLEPMRTRGKNWHNAYELNDCKLGRSSNNLENAAACIFIGH